MRDLDAELDFAERSVDFSRERVRIADQSLRHALANLGEVRRKIAERDGAELRKEE